jgi:hypothetical protein
MVNVILKRFESPDETRTFSRAKFEVIHIGGMTIGRDVPPMSQAGAGRSMSAGQLAARFARWNT